MAGDSQTLNRLIKAILSTQAPGFVDAIDFCSGFSRNDLSCKKRLPFSIEGASEADCDKRARLINPLACWRAWFSIFTALWHQPDTLSVVFFLQESGKQAINETACCIHQVKQQR